MAFGNWDWNLQFRGISALTYLRVIEPPVPKLPGSPSVIELPGIEFGVSMCWHLRSWPQHLTVLPVPSSCWVVKLFCCMTNPCTFSFQPGCVFSFLLFGSRWGDISLDGHVVLSSQEFGLKSIVAIVICFVLPLYSSKNNKYKINKGSISFLNYHIITRALLWAPNCLT